MAFFCFHSFRVLGKQVFNDKIHFYYCAKATKLALSELGNLISADTKYLNEKHVKNLQTKCMLEALESMHISTKHTLTPI